MKILDELLSLFDVHTCIELTKQKITNKEDYRGYEYTYVATMERWNLFSKKRCTQYKLFNDYTNYVSNTGWFDINGDFLDKSLGEAICKFNHDLMAKEMKEENRKTAERASR